MLGCAKEKPVENEFLTLKKANLPIPMQFDFSAIPDITVPFTTCTPTEMKVSLPGKLWLNGTTSYFGKIDEKKSYILNTKCELIDGKTVKEIFSGMITTSDGDNFIFTGWIQIDVSNTAKTLSVPVVGEILVTGGTGIFDGVKGSVTISGSADYANGTIDWSGDGIMKYN
jgi:hypothetical protein